MEDSIFETRQRLNQFINDRDWSQFHTPKNLMLAISGEVGELSELMQWGTDLEILDDACFNTKKYADEIADIFIYLVRLSDILGIDLLEIVNEKINDNADKYPVDKSKGNAKKYTEHE